MNIKTKASVNDIVEFFCDDQGKNLKGVVKEVNATISKTEKDIWYRIEGPLIKSSSEYCVKESDIVDVQ